MRLTALIWAIASITLGADAIVSHEPWEFVFALYTLLDLAHQLDRDAG